MPRLPNFVIAGAPKCGTTSLAAWLGQHPRVYMSPLKEPAYFALDLESRSVRSWEVYTRLFEGAGQQDIAVGEASTAYLFSHAAIPCIEKQLPAVRYIVMIRNPIEMAYSLHEQQQYIGNENVTDFSEAWHLSAERRGGRKVPARCHEPLMLDYQSFCQLGEQLERLLQIVPSDRILILVLDDLRKDPRVEYSKALEFLGLPDDGRTEFRVHNPAKGWRSRWLGRGVRQFAIAVSTAKYRMNVLPKRSLGVVRFLQERATKYRPRAPMSAELRRELRDFYSEDVSKLERILERDLSAWRE